MPGWELAEDFDKNDTITAQHTDENGNLYTAVVEVDNAGNVTRLEVTGANVTSELLRSIPVGTLSLAGVFVARGIGITPITQKEQQSITLHSDMDKLGQEILAKWPRKKDGDTAKNIATMYEHAVMNGLPPTQFITDELDVAKSTAGRMVAFARKVGALTINAVSIPGARKGSGKSGAKETSGG